MSLVIIVCRLWSIVCQYRPFNPLRLGNRSPQSIGKLGPQVGRFFLTESAQRIQHLIQPDPQPPIHGALHQILRLLYREFSQSHAHPTTDH